MSAPADGRLVIESPPGWRRIPAGDVARWAGEVVGGFGPAAVAALAEVAVAARTGSPGIPFVFTDGGPAAQAWAFLRMTPRESAEAESAVANAEQVLTGPGGGEVEVWHREVRRVLVASAPGVLMTDLLVVPRGDDREVQRRAVVAWFPARPVMLHLTLSTPSSTLGDVAAESLRFANGVAEEIARG